ncbi:hypothetical protein GCM10009775_21840 [Microbacterium aoyamense]|uniref:Uncharacterized protein n=1 Tax=Microbacterium aoyamense TaxID=344166 RepID=A0ABN2PSK3_9MICO|nr:hypothetical protein [Microbacterium aoyamense]
MTERSTSPGDSTGDDGFDDDTRTVRLRRSDAAVRDDAPIDDDGSTVVVRRESRRRAEAAASAAARTEDEGADDATVVSTTRRGSRAEVESAAVDARPVESGPILYGPRMVEAAHVPRSARVPHAPQAPVDTAGIDASRRRRARRRLMVAFAVASIVMALSLTALVVLLTTA